MTWTVAFLIIAVAAVGPLAAKEIEDRLSYDNVDDMTITNIELISEEEPARSFPAERANLPTCEDFGGKCIPKRGAEMKCKGRMGAQFDCSNARKVCCIDGCPKGTFWFTPSNQCFKLLTDTRRTWFEARAECINEGLVLARPYLTVELREYLVMRYGHDVEPWLNARGNGTYVVWQNNGDVITKENPRWWPEQPGDRITPDNCLVLRARESFWKQQPDKPLWSSYCSGIQILALCEWELK